MACKKDIQMLLDASVPFFRSRHIASASLVGSFARGTAHDTSDIDIAVWPDSEWDASEWDLLLDDLEALPTLKKWDLVRMDGPVSPLMREKVERDGIVLF